MNYSAEAGLCCVVDPLRLIYSAKSGLKLLCRYPPEIELFREVRVDLGL